MYLVLPVFPFECDTVEPTHVFLLFSPSLARPGNWSRRLLQVVTSWLWQMFFSKLVIALWVLHCCLPESSTPPPPGPLVYLNHLPNWVSSQGHVLRDVSWFQHGCFQPSAWFFVALMPLKTDFCLVLYSCSLLSNYSVLSTVPNIFTYFVSLSLFNIPVRSL